MQRITSESSVDETLQQIGVGEGEELRESEKRRNTLEKFAQIRSRKPSTTLSIKDTPTAFVEAKEDVDDRKKEFTDITVTSKRFNQLNSELPPQYHDYVIQKAMTAHEVGHILYSSYQKFKEILDKIEDEESEEDAMLFKNVCNALEDGAIENFLGLDYRIEEELFYMRKIIHEDTYVGEKQQTADQTIYFYTFFTAVLSALINIGVYDNGELEKVLDEDNDKYQLAYNGKGRNPDKELLVDLLPTIREYIDRIQREEDAEKRVDLSYELWKEIKKGLDQSTTPGYNEFKRKQTHQDSDSYHPQVPQNISEGHGEQSSQPTEGGSEGDEERTLADARTEISEGEIEKKAEREILSESKQEGDNVEDELEEIINSLGAGEGVDEVFIPEDDDVDTTRKQEAEILGRRCKRIFQNRLHKSRKDKTLRGKRRGDFDSRRVMSADRGETNVFKQIQEGDNKDYSCIIACDRSGSMRGRIEEVELAAGGVVYGLESIGVSTSLIDTYDSKTAIAKPFQTKVDNWVEKIFAGRVSGGTPLRYTLQFAKQRMKRGDGSVPFMIVITDGRPRKEEAVKEEIKTCNFPVIGIYLTNNSDSVKDQLKLYDRAIAVENDEDVAAKLINLINSIIF